MHIIFQARAKSEARSLMVSSQIEEETSKSILNSAITLSQIPSAMELKYLETLNNIA